MSTRYIFLLILGVDALILFLQINTLSISYIEAKIVFSENSFLSYLINLSLNLFGQNDIALRLVMLLFHLMSVVLMYLISKRYIKKERDRLWLLVVFILLPGVVSSAIVVNSAGMIIFGLLLFIYTSESKPPIYSNVLLLLYSVIDIGFAYLFLALSVYYISQKKWKNFIYVLGLYILTSYLYGFEINSITGHFLDTIGLYSAVFTPIIFIYVFYTLYKKYLSSDVDMLWHIASVVLVISLVLSFRQKVPVEHFAPYLIVSLPLSAKLFINSYNVRLKIFRKKYKLLFSLSLLFLITNTLVLLLNKELYPFSQNPQQHFVYKMHVAKELAKELKAKNITCVKTGNRMQLRLQFYEISQCSQNKLTEYSLKSKNENINVTLSYKNTIVYKATVTKLNNI